MHAGSNAAWLPCTACTALQEENIPLHYSEFGLGGGKSIDGTVVATTPAEAAKFPFFGRERARPEFHHHTVLLSEIARILCAHLMAMASPFTGLGLAHHMQPSAHRTVLSTAFVPRHPGTYPKQYTASLDPWTNPGTA